MGIKEDPLDKSLKIEKLTLDLEGDDDGPGGFVLEDFAGVETGFDKESLEQRKVRVLKARERLRAKKEQALELKRKAEEAKEFAEDQPGGDLKGVMGGDRFAPPRPPAGGSLGRTLGGPYMQPTGDGKGGFFQQLSQSKETEVATKDVAAQKLKLRGDSRHRLPAAISQPHPNTIRETITNESSVPSKGGTQRYAKDMKITVAVSSRDLAKGAGGRWNRNLSQKRRSDQWMVVFLFK